MNVDDDRERIIKGEKGGESRSPKSKSKKKSKHFFLQWGIKMDCIGRSNICLEVVGKSGG